MNLVNTDICKGLNTVDADVYKGLKTLNTDTCKELNTIYADICKEMNAIITDICWIEGMNTVSTDICIVLNTGSTDVCEGLNSDTCQLFGSDRHGSSKCECLKLCKGLGNQKSRLFCIIDISKGLITMLVERLMNTWDPRDFSEGLDTAQDELVCVKPTLDWNYFINKRFYQWSWFYHLNKDWLLKWIST